MEYPQINLEVAFQFICTKCNKKNFVSGREHRNMQHPDIDAPVDFMEIPETVICNGCRTIYRTAPPGW